MRCRKISMMEISLHLMREKMTWSSFYARKIWIVLPNEKKTFVVNGEMQEGLAGGGDYAAYRRRDLAKFGDLCMEGYYCLASVKF